MRPFVDAKIANDGLMGLASCDPLKMRFKDVIKATNELIGLTPCDPLKIRSPKDVITARNMRPSKNVILQRCDQSQRQADGPHDMRAFKNVILQVCDHSYH